MSILDSQGRNLGSLRISVTDRCNLRCQYCMPEQDYTWLPRENILTFEEIGRLVDVFTGLGVDRVRITGGEPLLRNDLGELIKLLSTKSSIRDLALTTNGFLLVEQAKALRAAGLHRITVSLDTLRRQRFQELTRFDALRNVQDGLNEATEQFAVVKIDTVVIRGVNDDELIDILKFGQQLGAEVRFIEYMDVGGATRWSSNDVVPRNEMIQILKAHYGCVNKIDEISSAPAERFRLEDGTKFGIISSTTAPFCRTCDRSRITADGMWYRCLYAPTGTDLRQPLRDGTSMTELSKLIESIWRTRNDRGAELRIEDSDRQALIPIETLRKEPHLEMHTRGG